MQSAESSDAQALPSPHAPSTNVIVRFAIPGPPRAFASAAPVALGAQVVVNTPKGQHLGEVGRQAAADAPIEGSVERLADAHDASMAARQQVREVEAAAYARRRIAELGLAIKLIGAQISHDGTHARLTFTAPVRVDFRALVKDLAQRLKMRVELQQVGVRDAARQTGGTGVCGNTLCCSTWLPEFAPISIRMAKDQNLALNQQKLSGVCGRLRCCLQYEQSTYVEQRKTLPKAGKSVRTPRGPGRVTDVNVLRGIVRVVLDGGGFAEFRGAEVSAVGSGGSITS